MTAFAAPLPIDDALARFAPRLRKTPRAVLVAPPGAGKTTRGAARAARRALGGGEAPARCSSRAASPPAPPRPRMAATLGEKVGETVGLRVRLQSLVSARTRIEVVTEGVFTRMILDDPSLEGVAAVLFDEFHERSLDADLGLALALDAQGALREDLRLLVMSATLDGARVARAPRRRAADRERRPRLSGRDPLCRARSARAHRGRGRARRAARRSRARPARCSSSCRGRARSAASPRCSRRASGGRTSTSRRSMARWTRARRTSPSRRRRPDGARSCSRPRSPRRR